LEFCHSHKPIPLIKVLFTVFDNDFLIKKSLSKSTVEKEISKKNKMAVSDRALISHLSLLTKKSFTAQPQLSPPRISFLLTLTLHRSHLALLRLL